MVLSLWRSSVLGWWWGWRWKSFALSNALGEIRLPSGVSCWLARTAMHLARLIQHVLKCVRGLYRPLRLHIRLHLSTASRSPLFLLILDSGHLPTAILGIRL